MDQGQIGREMLKQENMMKKKKKWKAMALAATPRLQEAALGPIGEALVSPVVQVPAVAIARAEKARAQTRCHWGHWVQGVTGGRALLVWVWAWA